MGIDVAYIALVISFIGIIISFINVNRQRKATLKNEEEKFKRELNLKTSDEVIELFFELLVHVRQYRIIDKSFLQSLSAEDYMDKIRVYNEHLWKLLEGSTPIIDRIESLFLKRSIILIRTSHRVNDLKEANNKLESRIWNLKSSLFIEKGYTEHQYIQDVEDIIEDANKIIIVIEEVIKEIQSNFLGHLYRS